MVLEDYFEIDFLDVEAKKSGDAICIRYRTNGDTYIHVVDGGYQSTGEKVVSHIRTHYDDPKFIDHVVATHQDGDHAGGLVEVLENFAVGKLWMLRPWDYAGELLGQFSRFSTVEGLRKALRDSYPNLVTLEDIAIKKGIEIAEPFQGTLIGDFRVMGPAKPRYLELIVSSEKTPRAARSAADMLGGLAGYVTEAAAKVLQKVGWGAEFFPVGGTSNENEMSVTQYACLSNLHILLTADTGRYGLQEIIDYAPIAGLALPGIDRFQVPHHGGRHNVDSRLLDQLLGPKLPVKPTAFHSTAIISSALADPDHPRKSVERAVWHRGAKLVTTEGKSIRTSGGAVPARPGWVAVAESPYPEEQEEWD